MQTLCGTYSNDSPLLISTINDRTLLVKKTNNTITLKPSHFQFVSSGGDAANTTFEIFSVILPGIKLYFYGRKGTLLNYIPSFVWS